MKNDSANDRDEKREGEPGSEEPTPARPAEAGWNFFYVVLVALIVVSLVVVLGIVNFGLVINALIYILTIVFLAVAVVHWLGAW